MTNTAYAEVTLEMLHRFLKLPSDVRIVEVDRSFDTGNFTVCLQGNLPSGKVTAHYLTTKPGVVTFSGWSNV